MNETDAWLQDAAAALSGARRELLVVSEACHDLSMRICRRAEDVDELRDTVDQVEHLRDELRAALGRAAEGADLVVERLRHDREELEILNQYPGRAGQHLYAAEEFLQRAAGSPGLDEEAGHRLSSLQAQLALVHDAVDQTTHTLAGGAAELERTENVLRPLVDDLHDGAEARTARAPMQAKEHLGAARSQVRQASLTSESASQNALAAARVAAESRVRLDREATHQTGHSAARLGRPVSR